VQVSGAAKGGNVVPYGNKIIAEMLDVPVKDRLKFHRWSNVAITSTSSRWGLLTALPHAVAFLRYIRKLVKARRANPEDDLVTVLVRAEEAGDRLSEDELLAMIFLLLVAGHETTVHLIGNRMPALLENPDQSNGLRDDPALIKSAVEELLRYNGPLETGVCLQPQMKSR
jgi:cytochrome P450